MRLTPKLIVAIAVAAAASWIVIAAAIVDELALSGDARLIADISVDAVFILITGAMALVLVSRLEATKAEALVAAELAAEEARRVSQRLGGLRDLDLRLHDETSLESIAATGARHVRASLDLDHVTVLLCDNDATTVTHVAAVGEPAVALLELARAPSTNVRVWDDLRMVQDDVPGVRAIVDGGFASGAIVPLVEEGRAIGCIGALSKGPRRFSTSDVETLTEVAARLRLSIRQSRDRDELDRRSARLELMHALDRAILEAAGPTDFATTTSRFLGRLLPCDRISVGLWDASREELTLVGTWVGQPPPMSSGPMETVVVMPFSPELRAFADLLGGGASRILTTDELPGTQLTYDARAAGVRAYYLVPMMSETGALIATIGLGSRDPDWFTVERRAVADEVAAQLAIGLRQTILRRQLAASERLFADVFALTPTPVTLTRVSDRIILAANDAACRAMGATAEALRGTSADPYAEWVVPEDRDAYVRALTTTGECLGFETSLRLPDGRVVRELLSARLIEVEGEPCILTAALDITERLAMEARLHQARKMEVMGQFASILAHDLRSYFNAVGWSADLLAERVPDADPLRRDVDQIRLAVDGGLGMIRNVLGFARPDANGNGATDVRDHLTQIGGIITRLVGPSVIVRVDAPEGLPAVALSSAGLTQVVFNLAANARDAMPEGGRFDITAEAVEIADVEDPVAADPLAPGRYVRLTVSDSGVGMDAQTASRAFDAFYSTHEATDSAAGTGLGLSSAYLIVTRAGGRIGVRSAPGAGTTFTIDLPTGVAPALGQKVRSRHAGPLVHLRSGPGGRGDDPPSRDPQPDPLGRGGG